MLGDSLLRRGDLLAHLLQVGLVAGNQGSLAVHGALGHGGLGLQLGHPAAQRGIIAGRKLGLGGLDGGSQRRLLFLKLGDAAL